MAYHEELADKVREIIAQTHTQVEEKKMFGGLCFMVNDKMCLGIESNRLMVRFNPEKTDEVMQKKGAYPMDFTKKVMKGFAFVDISALNTKMALQYWVKLALDYNSIAKSSKKQKKK